MLINQSGYAAVEGLIDAERLPDIALKGIHKPVPAYNVLALKRARDAGQGDLPDGLTSREAEVLQLLANGRSSREIGEDLYLSVRTVERHIANVYLKIDAHGRADATAYAVKRGLA